jgi:class 3 adenylate cyclase
VSELPSGTVTFLFSDIEGSTRLMQRLGDQWADALATHNRLLREAFAAGGGREVDRQGDAFFAVFPRAREAVAAAVAAQRSLSAERWPDDAELRVRMGLHTGEPAVGEEGYLGVDVVRASRICGLASGAQVLVSETTRALVRGDGSGLDFVDLGHHRLKDLDEPERLYAVGAEGLRRDLASRPPADVRALPGHFEGHASQLAERARQALEQGDLRLDELDQIGPRIEHQVGEMLRSMGVPSAPKPPDPPDAAKPREIAGPDRHRGGMSTATLVWLTIGGILVAVPVLSMLLDRF